MLKINMFTVAAPFDRPGTGDDDYVRAINKLLNGHQNDELSLTSQHIRPDTITPSLRHAITKPGSKVDKPTLDKLELQRKQGIQYIIDEINSFYDRADIDDELKGSPVLSIQIRLPQTGSLILPKEIQEIKDEINEALPRLKVVVTCHEYALHDEDGSPYTDPLKNLTTEYLTQADHVFFFNKIDKTRAIEALTESSDIAQKVSLTQVAITASIPTDDDPPVNPPILNWPDNANELLGLEDQTERGANIMFFGSIRSGKCFFQAAKLAKKIQAQSSNSKVIVAGGATDSREVAELIALSLDLSAIDDDRAPRIDALLKYVKDFCDPMKKGVPTSLKFKNVDAFLRSALNNNKRMQDDPDNPQAEMLRDPEFCRLLSDAIDLPIEFHFYVPESDLPSLFKQCKYACICDFLKGFAFNASAIIAALAHGCILFTNRGFCTPEDDRTPCILFPDPINNLISDKLNELIAEHIFDEIQLREENPLQTLNREQLTKLARLFEEYFSPEAIKNSIISGLYKMFDYSPTYPPLPPSTPTNIHDLRRSMTPRASLISLTSPREVLFSPIEPKKALSTSEENLTSFAEDNAPPISTTVTRPIAYRPNQRQRQRPGPQKWRSPDPEGLQPEAKISNIIPRK